MRFQRIQFVLFVFTLFISMLMLLVALIPGDWSPLGLFQGFANSFARDGSFGGLDLAFYRKIQWAGLFVGLALLAVSRLFFYASQHSRPVLARNLALGVGAGYLLVLMIVGEVMIGRSHSLVFQQVFGTPPPTPTPVIYPTAVPPPTTYGTGRWQMVVEGLTFPTAIVDAGDGSGRLFVLEANGKIRVIQGDILLSEPFLDLRKRSIQKPENFEQGLLGLAFHPQFTENGYFYVYYIDYQDNSVLSRFQTPDRQRGDLDSEFRLLGLIQPGARHNGGTLVFGPDGYLYVSVGDGDLRQRTKGHAQSLDELFGKILRLDVDHGNPYGIPPDNPFVNAYGRDEIYLYGLRNPWKFSFDPVTGDLYIGDVGQNDWEEINFLAAGESAGLNFGWDVREGPQDFSGYRGAPVQDPVFIEPIYYYHHKPIHCSVIGGVVYNGEAFPKLRGTYLFGDFCSGYIWGLKRNAAGIWEAQILYDTDAQITTFGTDAAGEVYLADYRGKIFKLVP